MKKMYKRYGTLRWQGEAYALLRPLPFEPEYAIPGTDAFFAAYKISIWADDNVYEYSNPHVVYVKGGYLLDMEHGEPEDIAVYIEKEMEAEPPYTINLKDKETEQEIWRVLDDYYAK